MERESRFGNTSDLSGIVNTDLHQAAVAADSEAGQVDIDFLAELVGLVDVVEVEHEGDGFAIGVVGALHVEGLEYVAGLVRRANAAFYNH